MGLPKAWRGLNAGAYPPLPLLVYPQPRLLEPSAAYRRFYQAGRLDSCEGRQVSRAPLPNSGVTSVGETWSVSWESITPPSSLILAHSPLPLGSLLLRFLASFGESLQVVSSPCCPRQLPDVILRILPWMLDPLPRRYTVCSRLFLPRCHRPSPTRKRVGFPHLLRLKRLLAAELFEDADISLCSGLQVCSPPRSSLPLRTPAGQPGLLHPSRTRFVASPRIGYANRLKTGNWRYRDFHPVRLSVLSAAPPCQPIFQPMSIGSVLADVSRRK